MGDQKRNIYITTPQGGNTDTERFKRNKSTDLQQ